MISHIQYRINFDKRIKQDGILAAKNKRIETDLLPFVLCGTRSSFSYFTRTTLSQGNTLAFLAVGITIITSRRIRDKRHDDSSPLFPFFSLISLLRFSRSTAGNPLLTFSVLGPHDGVRI